MLQRLNLKYDGRLSNFAFKINLRRYTSGRSCRSPPPPSVSSRSGRAVQVNRAWSVDCTWSERLKLKYDEVLSSFAFNFYLHPYTAGRRAAEHRREPVTRPGKGTIRTSRRGGGARGGGGGGCFSSGLGGGCCCRRGDGSGVGGGGRAWPIAPFSG